MSYLVFYMSAVADESYSVRHISTDLFCRSTIKGFLDF